MIEIDGLVKKYDERTVLDGITLTFKKGEISAIVGPSGGGKSTLLRCLNGLETFDAGSVSIGGARLGPGDHDRQTLLGIRRRAGFVFQQWHLFAHRTALGNVIEAPVHVRKTPVAEATEKAKALLAKVSMSHREKAYPRELSGGEQQRVAIARALAMEPDVLLLDEPTSALDPQRVKDLVELLARLGKEGLTLLVVTHDEDFVRDLCQRAVRLEGGKVMGDGSPHEVVGDD